MFIVVVNIGDVVVDIQELKQLCLEQDHTDIVDHANDSLRIWQAAKAQVVPDGFVVVPKEPTEEMLIDGTFAWCRNEGVHDIYKAMIEAAPRTIFKTN